MGRSQWWCGCNLFWQRGGAVTCACASVCCREEHICSNFGFFQFCLKWSWEGGGADVMSWVVVDVWKVGQLPESISMHAMIWTAEICCLLRMDLALWRYSQSLDENLQSFCCCCLTSCEEVCLGQDLQWLTHTANDWSSTAFPQVVFRPDVQILMKWYGDGECINYAWVVTVHRRNTAQRCCECRMAVLSDLFTLVSPFIPPPPPKWKSFMFFLALALLWDYTAKITVHVEM